MLRGQPVTSHGCYPLCRDCKNARGREEHRRNRHRDWLRDYIRRATEMGLVPRVEHFTRSDLIERWGDQCYFCGGPFEEIDHYIPIAAHGDHSVLNCRPSCRSCNGLKGSLVISGKGVDLDEMNAAIDRAAATIGLRLQAWQRRYLLAMMSGEQVVVSRGRRGGWFTVQRVAQELQKEWR